MCFSKNASIFMFIAAVITQILLVKFGKKEYSKTNLQIAQIFFWVSLMQLIDLSVWMDLDCNGYYNKLGGIIGPILNYMQPIIVFLVIQNFTKPWVNVLSIIYIIIFAIYYCNYLSKGEFCSFKNSKGHITWSWYNNISYNFLSKLIVWCYYIMMLVILVLLWNDKYLMISYIIIILCLIISYKFFYTNIGEIWCFLVVPVPLLILIIQRCLQ